MTPLVRLLCDTFGEAAVLLVRLLCDTFGEAAVLLVRLLCLGHAQHVLGRGLRCM